MIASPPMRWQRSEDWAPACDAIGSRPCRRMSGDRVATSSDDSTNATTQTAHVVLITLFERDLLEKAAKLTTLDEVGYA